MSTFIVQSLLACNAGNSVVKREECNKNSEEQAQVQENLLWILLTTQIEIVQRRMTLFVVVGILGRLRNG